MIPNLMSKSRVTEVSATAMRIIGTYKKTSLNSDPYLEKMFTALDPQSTLLSDAINRLKFESTLEEKDDIRDTKIRNLNYLILGLLHHPNPEIRAAAREVKKVFDKYGLDITTESYTIESALIVSLLNDLLKPKLQAAIALLSGCAELITEIQTAEDDFKETQMTYDGEKAEEGIKENATTLKKEVLKLINGKIVIYLRAMEIVNEPVYGAFARTVAEIISDNNEAVKKRNNKSGEE